MQILAKRFLNLTWGDKYNNKITLIVFLLIIGIYLFKVILEIISHSQ